MVVCRRDPEFFELTFTENDLRWLLSRKYIEHSEEVTESGNQRLRFQIRNEQFVFSDSSCFVLIDIDVQLVSADRTSEPGKKPRWDSVRH